ncbi:MAG: hypothetical protein WCR55_01925 [Lentisphaerota bacterium]
MITEKRIASLDIGISAVMLLLVSCDKSDHFEIINEFGGISRLGLGISKTNLLSDEKMEATLNICKEIIDITEKSGVDKIIVTASSGIKNAINKTQFLISCRTKFNIFPNILTEQEEAKLIYKGATSKYLDEERPIIVIEVGGDSTYIAFGRKGTMIKSNIIEIGSFHIFDNPNKYNGILSFLNPKLKYFISDNFTSFRNEILSWLDGRKPVVICSGTLASVLYSALIGKLVVSRSSMEGKVCSVKSLHKVYRSVNRKKLEDRKKLPGIDAERAQTLPTALNILSEILKLLGTHEFTLTANGLRTGILKSYTEKNSFLE